MLKKTLTLIAILQIDARPESPQMEIRLDGLAMRLIKVSSNPDKRNGKILYMQDTEVTNAQYSIFLKEEGMKKYDPSKSKYLDKNREEDSWNGADYPAGKGDHPVVFVSPEKCMQFCEWLTKRSPMLEGEFRLPTKGEWLHAAYGNDRLYPWGSEIRKNAYSIKNTSNWGKFWTTTPVKNFERGKTPDGIYDMWGNVSELISIYNKDDNSYTVVPFWLGGSFMSDKLFRPKQAYWGFAHASDFRASDIGFRVVFVLVQRE